MSLTAFREAVHTELEKDLGIRFERGIVTGPNESYDVGSLWIARGSEDSSNVLEQHLEMRVRVYKLFTADPDIPVNPADLEDLVEKVQASLTDIQTAASVQATGVWMFRVTDFEIDLETNGVELVVLAIRQNPFLSGA